MSVGRARSAVRALIIAGMLVALLGACAGGGTSVPPPSVAVSPAASASASMTATASQIGASLRAAGLLSAVASVPYRPAESPTLTRRRGSCSRPPPGDDRQGFVVIYDFPDAGRAYAAGPRWPTTSRTGPGRVQFPNDASFVMRQVGSTLVFYTWTDSDAPEPMPEPWRPRSPASGSRSRSPARPDPAPG